MNYNAILIKYFKKLNMEPTQSQINQLIQYYHLMIEWNKVMNLTSIIDYEEVLLKHYLDSLSIKDYYDLSTVHTFIDIGTGAGFPGIPLKIMFPHLKIVLLDSLQKRINFLKEVIQSLELQNIEAIHGRAEELAQLPQYRENFDLCVSRAVANLSVLTEYCIPFVKIGGCFISYKSDKCSEEIEGVTNTLKILGGSIDKVEEFNLADTEIKRNLIFINKDIKTDKKYPRKSGLPSKNPLC